MWCGRSRTRCRSACAELSSSRAKPKLFRPADCAQGHFSRPGAITAPLAALLAALVAAPPVLASGYAGSSSALLLAHPLAIKTRCFRVSQTLRKKHKKGAFSSLCDTTIVWMCSSPLHFLKLSLGAGQHSQTVNTINKPSGVRTVFVAESRMLCERACSKPEKSGSFFLTRLNTEHNHSPSELEQSEPLFEPALV